MQLCEVFDLVGRVRRRRRVLRLVLAVIGRRLVVVLLLLPGPRGLMVSNRRSAHRSDHQRPPPYTSPETHGKLLPVRLADLRLSGQCASIVVLDRGAPDRGIVLSAGVPLGCLDICSQARRDRVRPALQRIRGPYVAVVKVGMVTAVA